MKARILTILQLLPHGNSLMSQLVHLSDTRSSNYLERCNVPNHHKPTATSNSNNVSFSCRLICLGESSRAESLQPATLESTNRTEIQETAYQIVENFPQRFIGFPLILTDTKAIKKIKTVRR